LRVSMDFEHNCITGGNHLALKTERMA